MPNSLASSRPSVSHGAAPLVAALVEAASALRLAVTTDPSGARLVDAGIGVPGGLVAGCRIAEICLGGLGNVTFAPDPGGALGVTVTTSDPVLACLASQYAGWSLQHAADGATFFALGSGPGRALAAKEPLFAELGYRDAADAAVLVLEVDRPPPSALLALVARDCGVAPERLTVIMTPTTSLAGTLQIVARSLEVALHKAHYLKFPLDRVVDGVGHAPLPPPAARFIEGMGRTNDAILYGGTVRLYVTGPEDEARALAEQLPSSASRDYGKPFAETFAAYHGDFYKIDPLLFSPGIVEVTALSTGRSFRRGRHDPALLARSFAVDIA